MTVSPKINLRFGSYIGCVANTDVLRQSIDVSQYRRGDAIIVTGNAGATDGTGGIYAWIPEATAPDDNYAWIEPASVSGGAGRWVLAVGPTPELLSIKAEVQGMEALLSALNTAVGNETAQREDDVAKLTAAITTEQIVRVTADEALASRTTTLEASYTSLKGDLAATSAKITDEQTARATADEAATQRMNTMVSEYNAIGSSATARITSEASTRAAADGAATSRMDQMVSEYNGIGSRVTVTEQAVSGLNGKLNAYWQVESVAGNNRAQLTVHADANGGAGVDIVGDVAISGNLLVSGTVTTSALVANSVSNGDVVSVPSTFVGGGGVSVTATTYSVGNWQTLISYTLTLANPARVMAEAMFKQSYASTDSAYPGAAIINVDNGTYIIDDYWGNAVQDKVPLLGSVDLAAGTHTITVQWQGDTRVTVYRPRLRVEWFYR
jgi:hypothetical protein